MQITFLNPQFLWFLSSVPLLIALHLVTMRFTKRKAMMFANFEAIKRVGGAGFLSGGIIKKNIIFLLLRVFTLIFLVVSLSGAILWYQGQSSSFDFVITVDASGSMLADDFAPNRLGAAKDAALLFLDSISKSSRVGVVSFSGITFVKQRLTEDKNVARQAIQALDIEFASGTAIGDAIVSSANLFSEGDNAKVIVLITDGQSNVGMLTDEAVLYSNKNHVTVYALGVATAEGGKFKDIDMVSKLDDATLKNIADNTGGKYYRVGNVEELRGAFKEIATTSKKNIPIKLAAPFLIAALALVFTEWVLINTRYRTIP